MSTTGFTIGIHDSWSTFAELFVRYPRPFARMKLTANESAIIIQMLSHKPGFKVTVEYLRANIEGLSRDKCYAALKRLDERGILNRHRLHDADGTFKGMHYELMPPPEYRRLAEAMQAAEDALSEAQPLPENKETDETDTESPLTETQEMAPTSQNSPEKQRNPSSGPFPGQPYTAQPDTAGTTQRKSKEKKTREKNTHQDAPEPDRTTEAQPKTSVCEFSEDQINQMKRTIHAAVVTRATGAVEIASNTQLYDLLDLAKQCRSLDVSTDEIENALNRRINNKTQYPYRVAREQLKTLLSRAKEPAFSPDADKDGQQYWFDEDGDGWPQLAPAQRACGGQCCDFGSEHYVAVVDDRKTGRARRAGSAFSCQTCKEAYKKQEAVAA